MKPLLNLMKATIETIVEAREHKHPIAFVNNMVAITGVAFNYEGLIEDVKEVQKNPDILNDMEQQAISFFGKKQGEESVRIIFKHVWVSIILTAGNMIQMAEELQQLDDGPKTIQA